MLFPTRRRPSPPPPRSSRPLRVQNAPLRPAAEPGSSPLLSAASPSQHLREGKQQSPSPPGTAPAPGGAGAPVSRGSGAAPRPPVPLRRRCRSAGLRGCGTEAAGRTEAQDGKRGRDPCPARSRRHESHETESREAISAFQQNSLHFRCFTSFHKFNL